MAAIMQEWQAILTTCKKIAEKTGAALPRDLQRMEGDVWARQAGRLRALSGWLREVEAVIPEKQVKTDEPEQQPKTLDKKPEGDQPPAIDPDSGLPLTRVPAPKPPRKKKAA